MFHVWTFWSGNTFNYYSTYWVRQFFNIWTCYIPRRRSIVEFIYRMLAPTLATTDMSVDLRTTIGSPRRSSVVVLVRPWVLVSIPMPLSGLGEAPAGWSRASLG
jgi:hypothetical protein